MPGEVAHYRPADPAGVVLPRPDDLSREIYDGFLARAYTDGENPAIFVVLAYGSVQDYALQLHRPEICYPASGYTISPVTELALGLGSRTVPACTMEATLGQREDRVLWWTRMASAFPTTVWQERREILAAAVRREVPDGVLVRFSTAGSPGSADRLKEFARSFITALPATIRPLLIGDAS